MSNPSVSIVEANADAVQGPAGKIVVGCFIFDTRGGRHEVTRIWKGKRRISLARDGEASASVTWDLDDTVTYVPAAVA